MFTCTVYMVFGVQGLGFGVRGGMVGIGLATVQAEESIISLPNSQRQHRTSHAPKDGGSGTARDPQASP